MRKHIVILLLCAVGATAAMSGAETPDSTARRLGEVVVKGAQAPRSVTATAPSVVVDREKIVTTAIVDVTDALQRMAGVNVRDYGGAGGLKTVSVRGLSASHTGVCYDGVPLSDVQTGQIDLSRYSVDNIQSVSLVVGDNDDIFQPARTASSASNVNISTMPVLGRRKLESKMRFGSFGYYNPYIDFATPLSSRAALNITGEFVHARNDYPFDLRNISVVTRERRTNSLMNSGHGEANLLWKPDSANTLTFKAYYYLNSRQLPGPVIYYTNESREHLREENIMAQGKWRSRLRQRLTLSGLMKYNFASSFYHDVNGKYPGGVLDQRYWQREYYTSWALLYVPSSHWVIDWSADYFYNSLTSNLISHLKPYRHSILASATAKYTNKHLVVTARLLGSLYLQRANNTELNRNTQKLSPSVSLSYRPIASQQFYLRASYKNIFRMPTFSEAYFDNHGKTVDLKPESTEQYNIGVTYSLPTQGILTECTVTADAYLNHVRDMIVAVPYNMFVWTMTNLGKVRTLGLDVTQSTVLAPHRRHNITLWVNYSLQRAMPVTDPSASEWKKQVAYIPMHSGSAGVAYKNPWANISISAIGVSHRFTTNNNLPATRISGYGELAVALWRDFTFGRHTVGARFDVLNLLDKQYQVIARYPMPGRSFRFTISYKLN